jgi:hypothetical protein
MMGPSYGVLFTGAVVAELIRVNYWCDGGGCVCVVVVISLEMVVVTK